MLNPVWSPRTQANISAPNYIIHQIRDGLINGQLNPGDRLPSETELATLCGVSRGSVRQAMKSLEMLGVISIRPGDATYINTAISQKNFNPLLFMLLISGPSTKEIADARYALERDIFELILAHDENLPELLENLERSIEQHQHLLQTNASLEALVENDLEFHRMLSSACGNSLIQTVYDYIMDFFKHYLMFTTARQADEDVTVGAHELIVQALRTRNYSMAKEVARNTVQLWYELMTSEQTQPTSST